MTATAALLLLAFFPPNVSADDGFTPCCKVAAIEGWTIDCSNSEPINAAYLGLKSNCAAGQQADDCPAMPCSEYYGIVQAHKDYCDADFPMSFSDGSSYDSEDYAHCAMRIPWL